MDDQQEQNARGEVANRSKSAKALFSQLLRSAFHQLASADKLGDSGRHEAECAKICGTDIKTLRRWLKAENLPQTDKWTTAQNGLKRAGLDSSLIEELHAIWSGESTTATSTPSGILRPLSREPGRDASEYSRDFEIVPANPFPKMCQIILDVPEQGSARDNFVVNGELRFARMPDSVDGIAVTIGVRRAVLLPVPTRCYVKPGSLYRPDTAHTKGGTGAAQAIFQVECDDLSAVLEGDQLKGETLANFLTTGERDGGPPEVEVLVQIETPGDLHVALKDALRGRSISQRKLAENWIARQIVKTVQEIDGSIRIGSCIVRWKDNS